MTAPNQAVRQLKDAAYLVTEGDRIEFANVELCSALGRRRDEVLALASFWELIPPEERGAFAAHRDQLLRGENPAPVHVHLADAKGHTVDFETAIEKVASHDPPRIVLVLRRPLRSLARARVDREVATALLGRLRRTPNGTAALRQLGRDLGKDLRTLGIGEALVRYSEMGLGELTLERTADGRNIISGTGLIDEEARSTVAHCDLTLGFLETALAGDGPHALGSEVACRSLGAPRCLFVLRTPQPVTR